MKKSVKTLALFLFVGTAALALQGCGSCSNSSDDDYVFKFLRIDDDAYEDGEEMVKCYFEANFPEARGHEVNIVMEVTDSDGENYSYEDEDGFVVPIRDARWYYDGVVTDDWMGVPQTDLEFIPDGQKIYVHFEAFDRTTSEFLGSTNTLSFRR